MSAIRHLDLLQQRPLLAAVSAVLAFAPAARAQCATDLISIDSIGVQGNLGSGTAAPNVARNFMSCDGRYVAFWSDASNLVPNDTNGVTDVFLKDRQIGTTTRLSVDSNGVEANGASTDPGISHDGRWVVFQSAATNLVANDTNAKIDVFLHDVQTGSTVRVSVDSSGVEGDRDSGRPDVTPDGRYVAFHSRATNLVAGDTNNTQDVFVYDAQTGMVERVSVDDAGVGGNQLSGNPAISASGRFIAFHSNASNLVLVDTNNTTDVFLRDRQLGTTRRMSTNDIDEEADYFSQTPSITPDGRYVAFSSIASNLIPNDGNNSFDVFVKDRLTGGIRRASVGSGGIQGNSTSQGNAISADGRFVGFVSAASNLVFGDTNGGPFDLLTDVFVHDFYLDYTDRVSVNSLGVQADNSSYAISLAANGAAVAFYSVATNMGFSDTNSASDLFAHFCGSAPPPAPYCSGDGTGTNCPCSNLGLPGNGCANSFNVAGGHLEGSGSASVSADTFTLTVSGLPPTASALYFQGEAQVAFGAGQVFGDGLRCAGGAVLRIGARVSVGGQSSIGASVPGDPLISVKGAVPAGVLSLRYYQAWYRNVAAFCAPEGFNLTNGLTVTWVP